jgi:hypothetical protein
MQYPTNKAYKSYSSSIHFLDQPSLPSHSTTGFLQASVATIILALTELKAGGHVLYASLCRLTWGKMTGNKKIFNKRSRVYVVGV